VCLQETTRRSVTWLPNISFRGGVAVSPLPCCVGGGHPLRHARGYPAVIGRFEGGPGSVEGPYRAVGRHRCSCVHPGAGPRKPRDVSRRYFERFFRLANVGVAGSSPVSCSSFTKRPRSVRSGALSHSERQRAVRRLGAPRRRSCVRFFFRAGGLPPAGRHPEISESDTQYRVV